MVGNDFVQLRLENVLRELDTARESGRAAAKDLDEAMNVIKFYANPKNYAVTETEWNWASQITIVDDSERIEHRNTVVAVGGRRARAYMQKKLGTLEDSD